MTSKCVNGSKALFPANAMKPESLTELLRFELSKYADYLHLKLKTVKTFYWYSNIANRALQFFQNQGASCLADISYKMMQNCASCILPNHLPALHLFAVHVGEQTNRPYLHLITSQMYSKRLVWDHDQQFKHLSAGGISIETFVELVDRLFQYRHDHGYSQSHSYLVLKVKNDFCLFLAANNLNFTLPLAKLWCNKANNPPYCINTKTVYRVLCLIASMASGCSPDSHQIFPLTKITAKQPPLWAKNEVEKFIADRKQDHLKVSTVNMYFLCVVKFLWYLDAKGIQCFQKITADLIKSFNLESKEHKNAYAKNAYNVRIRHFLNWLYVCGIIEQDLGRALPTNSAPQVRPVQILTKEQQERIDAYCQQKDHSSRIYYRDVAVIKIMRYMGLRASDVAELKFSSINLKDQELNLNQKKTGKALRLPIPTHVLNSIITYIERERPTPLVKTELIFLSCNAPFGGLKRHQIEYSVKRVLGCCQCHMLRRTFATGLMIGQTDLSLIAQTLGHSNTNNVHKYLNTDQQRMLACTLSFAGIEYNGSYL